MGKRDFFIFAIDPQQFEFASNAWSPRWRLAEQNLFRKIESRRSIRPLPAFEKALNVQLNSPKADSVRTAERSLCFEKNVIANAAPGQCSSANQSDTAPAGSRAGAPTRKIARGLPYHPTFAQRNNRGLACRGSQLAPVKV